MVTKKTVHLYTSCHSRNGLVRPFVFWVKIGQDLAYLSNILVHLLIQCQSVKCNRELFNY